MKSPAQPPRCPWAAAEIQHVYHDTEWGVPSHDDRHLFEMLILEGAQAGLSWSTILKKRASYRVAYDDFAVAKVARYDARRQARLLLNPGIEHHWKNSKQIPVLSPESDALSRDLKKRGFKFVGSTICYAFMQATGLVNDHLVTCPRHAACARLT